MKSPALVDHHVCGIIPMIVSHVAVLGKLLIPCCLGPYGSNGYVVEQKILNYDWPKLLTKS